MSARMINIVGLDGTKAVRFVSDYGPLCIVELPNGQYSLTHVATGWAVRLGYTFDELTDLAKMCAHLDWSGEREEMCLRLKPAMKKIFAKWEAAMQGK